jgi:hypothetical protein
LINDVLTKTAIGNAIIGKHKNIINGYIDTISSEISNDLDSTDLFSDVVNK